MLALDKSCSTHRLDPAGIPPTVGTRRETFEDSVVLRLQQVSNKMLELERREGGETVVRHGTPRPRRSKQLPNNLCDRRRSSLVISRDKLRDALHSIHSMAAPARQ